MKPQHLEEVLEKTKKIYDHSSNFINFKAGLIGGSAAGTVVYFMNDEHGIKYGIFAGITQLAYNVFIGGFITKHSQTIANNIENKTEALIKSSLIPTFEAFLIGYSFHKLGGTPDSLQSSTWQIVPNLLLLYSVGLTTINEINNTHNKYTRFFSKLL